MIIRTTTSIVNDAASRSYDDGWRLSRWGETDMRTYTCSILFKISLYKCCFNNGLLWHCAPFSRQSYLHEKSHAKIFVNENG